MTPKMDWKPGYMEIITNQSVHMRTREKAKNRKEGHVH